MNNAVNSITAGGSTVYTPSASASGRVDLRERAAQSDAASERAHSAPRTPRAVEVQFHKSSDRWYVVVKDRPNGKVLRTLPPEAMLRAIGRIRQMIGVVLDERH